MTDGRPILAALLLEAGSLLTGNALLAREKPLIEEIIVTAQRVEEDAQRVPIAVSAFTDAMISDRQIIGLLDIQVNLPNVSATESNFGGRQLSIRGSAALLKFRGARRILCHIT